MALNNQPKTIKRAGELENGMLYLGKRKYNTRHISDSSFKRLHRVLSSEVVDKCFEMNTDFTITMYFVTYKQTRVTWSPCADGTLDYIYPQPDGDVCPMCGELCELNGDAVCYECQHRQPEPEHICNNCGGNPYEGWHEIRVDVDDYRCWNMPAHYTGWQADFI